MNTRTKLQKKRRRNTRLKGSSAIGFIFLLIAVLVGLIYFKTHSTLFIKPEQKLNVPIENQLPNLPNGCEVTSLSMLLNYYGIKTNKDELAQNIAHVSSYDGKYRGNPHKGFVGYMSQANGGWCVYNEPLYNVASKYTNRICNATGENFDQVIDLVASGHPVLIITTLKYQPVHDMQTWHTREGIVHVTPSSHACVITGYDKKNNTIFVNDPYGIKDKKVNWQKLAASYNQQGKQALYIN